MMTAALLLFNRNGFLANRRLELRMSETRMEVESLRAKLDSLETVVVRLENDSAYLEARVREVLGWGRPGEHIVRFVEPR